MYPEPSPSSKKCANADRASASYTLICYEIVVIIRQISESVLALRNSARSQCPRLLFRKVEQFDVVPDTLRGRRNRHQRVGCAV